MKRAFDIFFALLILAITWPLFILAAIGIKIFSNGPVFYSSLRVGKNKCLFKILKFRTMNVHTGGASITAYRDERIFPFGSFLRKSKIDELPQLFNVILGDLSIVGPRPEDPKIVDRYYNDWMLETLMVRPGITSPGSVFYYLYGEELIDSADPEAFYVSNLLYRKLAIDYSYIDIATLRTDFSIILMTIFAIIGVRLKFGNSYFDNVPQLCGNKQ